MYLMNIENQKKNTKSNEVGMNSLSLSSSLARGPRIPPSPKSLVITRTDGPSGMAAAPFAPRSLEESVTRPRSADGLKDSRRLSVWGDWRSEIGVFWNTWEVLL